MSKPKDDSFDKSRPNKTKQNKPPNIFKNQNLRIIQKNLVYVIGLSSNIADNEILLRHEYFGQYGSINKLVVNKNKAYNPLGQNGPSYSAYITFSSDQEASITILSIDNTTYDEHLLRASFGTTKYCTYYLKGLDCSNKECLYLHFIADQNDIIHRDEMNTDKSIFQEQQLHAIRIADIYNPDVINRIKTTFNKSICSKFPSPHTIFSKEIVVQNNPSYNNKYKAYSLKNHRKTEDYQYDNYEVYEENYKYFDRNRQNYYSGGKSWKYAKNPRNDREVVNYMKSSDTYSNSNKNSATENNKNLNTLSNNKQSNEKEGNKQINLEMIMKNEVEKIEENSEIIKISENNSDINELVGNYLREKKSYRIKNMFEKQDRSRFKFADSRMANEEIVSIPEYISEIIKRKISLHYFISKYSFDFDDKLEERLLSNKISDDWIQFIQSLKQNCTVN